MLLLLLESPCSHPWLTLLRTTQLLTVPLNPMPFLPLPAHRRRLLLASPDSHPWPTLPRTTVRLLHPPSLLRASGRVAVNKNTSPGTHARANVGRLSSSPRRTTRRPTRDVGRASCVRGGAPPCDAGQRGGWHVARKAIYIQGRTPGASGGAGSDVVDTRSALHPTALPVPSFVSPVHP